MWCSVTFECFWNIIIQKKKISILISAVKISTLMQTFFGLKLLNAVKAGRG